MAASGYSSRGTLIGMALASRPAQRAFLGSGQLGFGACGIPRREAYEWGVRSTRKPEPPPLDRVYEIPGLEPITYAGKMHFVPGLARPVFPPWDRGWKHPRYHRSPPIHEQPLYKEEPCYIFHQRCRLLEGVKQALWLTKTKLIEGLPEKVSSLVDEQQNHIENQDERVLNIISHARLWHSMEDIPKRETYCPIIVDSLLQLCKSQILKYPSVARRICAKNHSLSAAWTRESVLLQVRGTSGIRLSAKDPLPPIASREEVEATRNHVLETFYPISPTIDLQECHVYDLKDDTGFQEGYPYPYPHTLYLMETADLQPHRFHPEQLRAKMILFAFGSALAQARLLYGDSKVLEQPIVVQSVGTDGRVFQFLVLQLNTTDLASNEGIKNLVWVDSDQLLYRHFWCRPVIKKKVVVNLITAPGMLLWSVGHHFVLQRQPCHPTHHPTLDLPAFIPAAPPQLPVLFSEAFWPIPALPCVREPVGPVDFQPETFRKFLALYLHGCPEP
ncbi:large ribosomal subunit protein mL37 isoform X2 [Cavia porcellus]|uniref:large ribosomal subunit protein mL37 isoform X2 n=1 Tax=Cavia porcellus TaxID=10141 RepID=UPI000661D91E|nr:39S ribosomal protein L37, mitochondrial isoform X2 [Cavia porcellus]